MKRLGLAITLLPLLAGCPKGSSTADFSGDYTGELVGNYNCTGGTDTFDFPSEEYDITDNGDGTFNIAVAFCQGLGLTGDASGDTLTVEPSGDTSVACSQTDDQGNTLTINDFSGGEFTFNSDGSLSVSLDEDITDPSGDTCSGTATGTVND